MKRTGVERSVDFTNRTNKCAAIHIAVFFRILLFIFSVITGAGMVIEILVQIKIQCTIVLLVTG
uniref:Uncharacterized protein n=1 Tax=Anguilla anguilla TaxID=7936 RepID=A0A0E9RG74_ANGAN